MSNKILEIDKLGIDFGGLTAVNNLSIHIDEKEIVGLIGPNGAGKTTVFNMLTKVYEPSRGDILLCGKSILNKNTIEVSKMGIARTFQNIRLFNNMSVLDNVLVGMDSSINYGVISSLTHLGRHNKEEQNAKDKAIELLKIFDMDKDCSIMAGSLPYGKQRRLEIVRALATNPSLLLLDEPAAGMNPQETKELMDTIEMIRNRFGISILLIEHDMSLVMGICERIYVLNYGMLLAEGKPEEIKNNPEVIAAYLGD